MRASARMINWPFMSSWTTRTRQIEHSPNGLRFQAKNAEPEIAVKKLLPGRTEITGGERRPLRPSHAFVRLRVTLGNRTCDAAAHVTIHATIRGRSRPEACCAPCLPGNRLDAAEIRSAAPARAPLLGSGAVRAFGAILRESRHLTVEERRHDLFARLDAGAQDEVLAFARWLRDLDPEAQERVAAHARALLEAGTDDDA